MRDIGILKLLSETAGVTGSEKSIAVIVKNIFEKFCNETIIDEFSNVIGVMKAKVRDYGNSEDKPVKIMYTAHLDEVGMIVKKIETGGFVKIGKIHGVDPKTLVSKKLTIHSSTGPIKGIVASIPPHLSNEEDRRKAVTFDDIYVDTGLSEESVKEKISVGDMVSFSQEFETYGLDMAAGKSLDNRAGVFSLIKTMQILKDKSFSYDIIFLAAVSEEFNSLGAITGTYKIEPDIAVVVDVNHAKMGVTDGGDNRQIFSQGKGPVVCKSPILSPKLTQGLVNICKGMGMKVQIEVDNKDTGTDALYVSLAQKGCATALLSIPLKYMHTQVEMINIKDIELTAEVMAQLSLQNSILVRDYICY